MTDITRDQVINYLSNLPVIEIANLVKRADATGRLPEKEALFPQFVESEDTRMNASIDPWGSQYYMVTSRTGFRVGSPGRDRIRNTTDDILSAELPLKSQEKVRRRR